MDGLSNSPEPVADSATTIAHYPPQFSASERLKGLHLLIDSRTDVQVQAEHVPTETTHLYPKLAGFNWTCYITTDSAVLGRSRTDQDKQTARAGEVYIGLGSSKAISRRHAEIKYNPRRKRWEIRVAGRNSIKVGHLVKKRGDPPIVLSTGSLLDIGGVQSVFILPDNYSGPPQETSTSTQSTVHSTEAATPNSENDTVQLGMDDDEALKQILGLLLKTTPNRRSTKDIVDFVCQNTQDKDSKEYNKETVLSMLVRSSYFYLEDISHTASQARSDEAQWTWDVQEGSDNTGQFRGQSHISQDMSECGDFEFNSTGSPGYTSQSPKDFGSSEGPWLGHGASIGISIADIYSTWIVANNRSVDTDDIYSVVLDRDTTRTTAENIDPVLPFKRIRTETDDGQAHYQGIVNL
ncbi:hypothetical protein J3Q64DRAFT_1692685 [Phycomyces blakesleeanus]|uniref:FHA domain-containing protein n=1 Tax=Phycomyces blakesleeanus TaxID=4837 RepID=A0ABR3BDJ0_PHYBL